MSSKLEQLKQITDVVADTGDIEAIRRFRPMDATTNPSLLLKAAEMPHYREMIAGLVNDSRARGDSIENCTDRLAVAIGAEISQLIPGRVSTEIDARLSFDSDAMIAKARHLIALYQQHDIPPSRVLIKVAATWEGIRAAEQLEREGIQCNLTLLFGFAQAAACADAGVTLISPFVGRILDWHVAHGNKPATPQADPGVQSVKRIYQYYKQHGYNTVVMGASFRSLAQIEQLAGCDRLTISPALLAELEQDTSVLERQLSAQGPFDAEERCSTNEAQFRWAMNDDAMATEKLAEGIRLFAADQVKLENLLEKL